jgi:RHS repeat-associated protein
VRSRFCTLATSVLAFTAPHLGAQQAERLRELISREVSLYNAGPTAVVRDDVVSREVSTFARTGETSPPILEVASRELSVFSTDTAMVRRDDVISRELSLRNIAVDRSVLEAVSRELSLFSLPPPPRPFVEVISRELSVFARDRDDELLEAVSREVSAFNSDTIFPIRVMLTAAPAPDGISIVLDWSTYPERVLGDISHYLIFWRTSAFSSIEGLTPDATVPAGVFRYVVPDLLEGVPYWFAVVAVDLQGNFDRVVDAVPATPDDRAPPEDVTDLAVECFETALRFTWTPSANSAGDLAGYRVTLEGRPSVDLPPDATSYLAAGLSPATAYDFRVQSRDTKGNLSAGAPPGAAIAGVTFLPNPTGLAAVPFTTSQVRLTWNESAPRNLIRHYAVYWSPESFTSVHGRTPGLPVNGTATVVTDLPNGVSQAFAVVTVNTCGAFDDRVTPVRATPVVDTIGPALSDLRFRGAVFASGATIRESGDFTVRASDNAGVARVELFVDGFRRHTDTAGAGGLYSFPFNALSFPDGEHNLSVRAFDGFDNPSTLSAAFVLDRAPLPPVAVVAGPLELSAAARSLTLDAGGSFDPDGMLQGFAGIASVQWDLGADGIGDDAARIGRATIVSLDEARAKGLSITRSVPLRLEVVDRDGVAARTTVSIRYQSSPPAAAAGGPYGPVGPGGSVQLLGMANDPDDSLGVGEFLRVEWDRAPASRADQVGDGFARRLDATVTYETLAAVVGTNATAVWLNVADGQGLVASARAEIEFEGPDLEAFGVGAPAEARAGQPLEVVWSVRNRGAAPAAGAWVDSISLSRDAVPGGDTLLVTTARSDPLGPGEMYEQRRTVPLPSGIQGDHWIVVTADGQSRVLEPGRESNNAALSGRISVRNPTADLVVSRIVAPLRAGDGETIRIEWTVRNAGELDGAGAWSDAVYLSSDPAPGGDGVPQNLTHTGGLAAGESYTGFKDFTVPAGLSGNFWFVVTTDFGGNVTEGPGEDNNTSVTTRPTEVYQTNFPDLRVESLTAPARGFQGTSVDLAWRVRNFGPIGTANGTWVDRVYLSQDTVPEPGEQIGEAPFSGQLRPDASGVYTRTLRATLPRTAGTWNVIVVTDAGGTIRETNDANNSLARAIVVEAPEYTALVSTEVVEALAATPTVRRTVPLSGRATRLADGAPAGNVPVTVRVLARDARRVFPLTTEADGSFTFEFAPLVGEAGRFDVFADHPAVMEDRLRPQDRFTLFGLRPDRDFEARNIVVDVLAAGAFQLRNLGDAALQGVTAAVEGGEDVITAAVEVPALIAEDATASLTYRLTASGLPPEPERGVTLTVRVSASVAGAPTEIASVRIVLFINPQQPRLVVRPDRLDGSMLAGASRVFSFEVTNEGGGAATDLAVEIPCTPNPGCSIDPADCAVDPALCPTGTWMNLVTPPRLASLLPGQTTVVEILLRPASDLTLGLYSGQIAVNAQETSLVVPYRFRAVTEGVGGLFVRVEDELTYYGEAGPLDGVDGSAALGPLLAGARVRLYDAVDGSLDADEDTDGSGTIRLASLPGGFYDLRVNAPGHSEFSRTVEIVPGQETAIAAFLQSQRVTYEWEVTPTEIQDVYEIRIEAVFETFVPQPVVTVEPALISLNLLPGEVLQVDLKITNQGLIAAESTELFVSDLPGYEVVALVRDIGTLPARQSVTVPVTIARLGGGAVAAQTTNPCDLVVTWGVRSCFHCGMEERCYWAQVYVRNPGECPGSPPTGGCPPEVCGSGEGGGGGGGASSSSPSYSQRIDCPVPPNQNGDPPPGCNLSTPEACCPEPGAPPGAPPGQPGKTDPVHLFSGELYQEVTDLRIPGRGMDFIWHRNYRSRFGPNTEQGNGWDYNYNLRIERHAEALVLCSGNGRRDVFTPEPGGKWTRAEFFQEIERNVGGTYTLTFANRGRWEFRALDGSPAQGRLAAIADRNGNTISFQYDAGGRLRLITDTLDRDVVVEHNADGFIESVTDWSGRSILYEYYQDGDAGGSFGDLKSVTSPVVVNVPEGHAFPAGKTTVYTYTKGFADARLNHNLLTITDPKGQTYLRNVYHHGLDPADRNFDRVIRQVWGDPGDIIDIVYVPLVPSVDNAQAVMKTIVNDREGNVSEHDFDILNRCIRMREYTGRADPDQPTTFTENRPRGKLRADDPDFFETRYGYNGDSLLTRVVHPNGNITENVYAGDIDPGTPARLRGNLRHVRRLPGSHRLVGDQEAIDEDSDYEDDLGGCCGSNFVDRHVDGRGNVTTHDYDERGNRMRTVHRIPAIVEDFEYNAFGQMTAHVLPDNGSGHRRRDEYRYYEEGPQRGYRSHSIVDAGEGGLRLTTTYEYDLVGNVVRMVDPKGNDTLYTVNELNQVVVERSREVTLTGRDQAPVRVRYERQYFFDANDNLVRVDVENLNDFGEVEPNRWWTTIHEYEVLNRRVRTLQETGTSSWPESMPECQQALVPPLDPPGGPDGADLSVSVRSLAEIPEGDRPAFIVTEFEYDALRNLTVTRSGEATAGRQPHNTVTNLYDERELLWRVIRAEGSADESTMQYDYDRNRNGVRMHEGGRRGEGGALVDAHTTVVEHDAYNRPVRTTDPMGNVTITSYDANSRRVGVRQEGEITEVPGSAANRRLAERVFVYDDMERMTEERVAFFRFDDDQNEVPLLADPNNPALRDNIENPGWAITRTEYTDSSQVRRVTDARGNATTTTYDRANRRAVVTDAKGNEMRYAYDDNSNVASVLEREISDVDRRIEEFTTRFEHDALDRQTAVIDNIGNTNRSFHDSRSNRTRTIDAKGNVVLYTHDGASREIDTIRIMTPTGDGDFRWSGDGRDTYPDPSEEVNIVTRKTWDRSHRLVGQTDDNGNTTAYEKDALGRQTATIYADCTVWRSWFDAHDVEVRKVDANQNDIRNRYDLNDRLVRRDVTVGPGVSDDTTFENYRHDGLGRLVWAEDDDSVVARRYDSPGNVLVERQTDVDVASEFDGMGNQIRLFYPSGLVVSTTYDALNRKLRIADQNAEIARYTYVGPGRVERRDYGNGTRTEYTYDGVQGVPNEPNDFGVKRVTRIQHRLLTDGGNIDDRTYAWDSIGNKTQQRDIRPGGPQIAQDYDYDSGYRKVRSTRTVPGGARRDVSYDLDGVGNRTLVAGGPDAGNYSMSATLPEPADRQMNQYTAIASDERRYDSNGNPILLNQGQAAERRLSHDYRNRLVEHAGQAPSEPSTYGYDTFGRRVRKLVGGVSPESVRYIQVDWQEIEHRELSSAGTQTFVYGVRIDEVLLSKTAEGAVYYHSDDLDSVRARTAPSGAIVERYEYSDFGRPQVVDAMGAPGPGNLDGKPLFTGRNWELRLGWYYYRTRYMDPGVGRFTSRDIIGVWGDDVALGNAYCYGGNNPLSHRDPYGLVARAGPGASDDSSDTGAGPTPKEGEMCSPGTTKATRICAWVPSNCDVVNPTCPPTCRQHMTCCIKIIETKVCCPLGTVDRATCRSVRRTLSVVCDSNGSISI